MKPMSRILEAASHRVCLVLMFKAPIRSKRRLVDDLGSLASKAAEHLWGCAHEDLNSWSGPVCFAPATQQDRQWLESKLGSKQCIVVQQGGNLGERINYVNKTLYEAGIETQIFIGIDCPELDAAYFKQALQSLEHHDAVFGPAMDGGVVLMAARHCWPELADLDWGGEELGPELVTRCRQHGWHTASLPCLSDVDTLDDLVALPQRLGSDRRPARRALCAWITELPA